MLSEGGSGYWTLVATMSDGRRTRNQQMDLNTQPTDWLLSLPQRAFIDQYFKWETLRQ